MSIHTEGVTVRIQAEVGYHPVSGERVVGSDVTWAVRMCASVPEEERLNQPTRASRQVRMDFYGHLPWLDLGTSRGAKSSSRGRGRPIGLWG